jgi:hypothetical protein
MAGLASGMGEGGDSTAGTAPWGSDSQPQTHPSAAPAVAAAGSDARAAREAEAPLPSEASAAWGKPATAGKRKQGNRAALEEEAAVPPPAIPPPSTTRKRRGGAGQKGAGQRRSAIEEEPLTMDGALVVELDGSAPLPAGSTPVTDQWVQCDRCETWRVVPAEWWPTVQVREGW